MVVKHPNEFASFSESINLVTSITQEFGISAYRLGQLLGMTHPNHAYQWIWGRRRPSSKYSMRITKIQRMVYKDKVRLPMVDHIDWITGEIFYKDTVNAENHNGVSSGKWTLPETAGGYRGTVAQFYHQSP